MMNIYKFLLKIALKLSNFNYKLISYLSIKVNNGVHPKHRLLKYHNFFLEHIKEDDTVLDIGCGNGELAFDISKKAKKVVAIDIDPKKISVAKEKYVGHNISYTIADATKDLDTEKFDIVILSNVLEHIEHRVDFLKGIKGKAEKYLIRVPMITRDWIPLYKKELGIEWRLDLTHFTEFSKESFYKEAGEAGYSIESFSVQFGEIWAILKS